MVWDPLWERIYQKNEWGKYPGEDVIRFVARNFYWVENRGEIKILEVGCGPGANIWYIAREKFEVYGIDGSKTAIANAKNRLENECPNWKGELRIGDIRNIPYPDGYFDAVIDVEAVSCNLLEYSYQIYGEMGRVTKLGGKIFSRTFATSCWGDGTGKKVGHNAYHVSEGPLADKGCVRFTSYDEIPPLLKDFEIEEIELQTRSYNNQKNIIKEWIIIGTKK